MAQTHDHEIVSIYPFTDEQVDELMTHAAEAVLMWGTQDGWPVGVIHAFVWKDGKIWITFSSHRHRAAAIKRDNRVSVTVSSLSYPVPNESLAAGSVTFKGRAEFFDDDDTKAWFYRALANKVSPNSQEGEDAFFSLLDSPLRTIIAVTPEKKIMYNSATAGKHMAGTASEDELGERLGVDRDRMNKVREERGLDPR